MNGPADILAGWPWAAWTVLLPFIAALLSFIDQRRAAAWGVGAGLATLLAVAGLVWQVVQQGAQRYAVGGWGAPLGIELYADGLSALMLAMTAVVGAVVSLYAVPYFGGTRADAAPAGTWFWPLWLLLWTALNALYLSADAFNLYVTLELLGLSAMALVALAGGAAAVGAAMRYLLVGLLGSLAYLLGVALLYASYATLDLAALRAAVAAGPAAWTAMALMTAGLLLKTALFPLHFWLPPAHANAPTPVSALLSALVVKASFYLLLRLWFDVFAPLATPLAYQMLGALGAAAVLWGSLQAFLATRLKLLVAYSTVAQLGYLFLAFPLAQGGAAFTAWSGAVYLALAHACAKAALFLTAGNIAQSAGHDRIAELPGPSQHLPVTLFAFGLAGVSLMGLPPSGGFVAKWLLLNAALAGGQWWWAAVIVLGGLLAAAYIFRVAVSAFRPAAADPGCRPVAAGMEWAALSLSILAILLGLAASPPLALLAVGAPVAGPVLTTGAP
ncbi:MAG: complex I subunit 5 family protein [Pseudomonadota bacterium]